MQTNLVLGKLDLLAAEVGKRDISNAEITSRHVLIESKKVRL